MLKSECKTCINKEYCEFLSRENCARCPSFLQCPDEKKAGPGFTMCEKSVVVSAKFKGPCELVHKFVLIGTKAFCRRCGTEALRIIRSYHTNITSSGGDITSHSVRVTPDLLEDAAFYVSGSSGSSDLRLTGITEVLCSRCDLQYHYSASSPLPVVDTVDPVFRQQ